MGKNLTSFSPRDRELRSGGPRCARLIRGCAMVLMGLIIVFSFWVDDEFYKMIFLSIEGGLECLQISILVNTKSI